ncbi:hypothetical protein BaRGS_00008474, partial [Batillaria attramentaria]
PSAVPQRLSGGQWNCSVPHWRDFAKHLNCNMALECVGGEDEVMCPRPSCGKGGIPVGDRCFVLLKSYKTITWFDAAARCKAGEMRIAHIDTPELLRAVAKDIVLTADISTQGTGPALQTSRHIPVRLSANQTWTNVSGIVCPDGHVTHSFLACDYLSRCFAQGFELKTDMWGIPDVTSCPALLTPLPPVMTCTSAQQHVPYSLVCDHRKDCQDGSDEEFCVFDPCPCYSIRQECDDRVDCFSKEDEVDCPTKTITRILVPDPPLIVNYDVPNIFTLDLSRVGLREFRLRMLSTLVNLQTLNLSESGIEHVLGEGQQMPRKLSVLDVRGCPLLTFPRNMLNST